MSSFQRVVCTGLGPEDVSLLERCPHFKSSVSMYNVHVYLHTMFMYMTAHWVTSIFTSRPV